MPESYQKNVRTSSSKRVNLYSNQQTQGPPKPLPVTPFTAPPNTSPATQALPCHRLHRPTARHLQGHPSPPLPPSSQSSSQATAWPPKPSPVTPFTVPLPGLGSTPSPTPAPSPPSPAARPPPGPPGTATTAA